jgi:hypothetical protein
MIRKFYVYYPLALCVAVIIVASTLWATGAAHAQTTPDFTTSGSQIMDNGVAWTPYGFSLSEFQDEDETFPSCSCEYSTIDAQLAAIAGPWHGNTVRLQVEQDEWVAGGSAQAGYRTKVEAVISDAESKGLVVVINDQSEGQDGFGIVNEPLPTGATVEFWQDMEQYKNDPDVILDPFNEPRYDNNSATSGWNDWHSGTGSSPMTWKNLNGGTQTSPAVGMQTLVNDIRNDGFTNQIWVEAPGYDDLENLVNNPTVYNITDPLNDVVYEYHHVGTGQDSPTNAAQWNAQFGDLVTNDHFAVVDGEWSMRSEASSDGDTVYEPSGDAGVCWGNAPSEVPVYLSYLLSLHIGMTVWTLGSEPPGGGYVVNSTPAGNGPLENGDSSSTYDTYNSYTQAQVTAGVAPCVTPTVGEYGAGADIRSWYTTNDANPAS